MPKKITDQLRRTAKSFDIFGTPVSLTVDGDSTHKTYFGSIVSILVFTITIIYGV